MKPLLSKKSFITLVAVSVVCTVPLAAMRIGKEPSASSNRPEAPVFVDIDLLTVNLQPENGEHVFELKCTVELKNERQGELLKRHMPEVRSRMILLTSGKKPSDLLSNRGKELLQKEMLAELKRPFTPSNRAIEPDALHFTSFIVD